jgi:hypothetical protein
LDKANVNTKWHDAKVTERSQLSDYHTLVDKGLGDAAPSGYKKIQYQMIYDAKHDGCHKARLVAGGHLTDPNTESVYSGVVSFQGSGLIIFLAELSELEIWGGNVGNSYLEALTKEKVYIIAGTEFGDLAGHTLLIFKAFDNLVCVGINALLTYFV